MLETSIRLINFDEKSTMLHKEFTDYKTERKLLMYAIAFDLDTKKMSDKFGEGNYRNKYKEIENFFEEHHFHWKQGSLYYGDSDRSKVDMPKTFKMLNKLSRTFPWFKECVRDVRILTIGEDDNLMDYLIDS